MLNQAWRVGLDLSGTGQVGELDEAWWVDSEANFGILVK